MSTYSFSGVDMSTSCTYVPMFGNSNQNIKVQTASTDYENLTDPSHQPELSDIDEEMSPMMESDINECQTSEHRAISGYVPVDIALKISAPPNISGYVPVDTALKISAPPNCYSIKDVNPFDTTSMTVRNDFPDSLGTGSVCQANPEYIVLFAKN